MKILKSIINILSWIKGEQTRGEHPTYIICIKGLSFGVVSVGVTGTLKLQCRNDSAEESDNDFGN